VRWVLIAAYLSAVAVATWGEVQEPSAQRLALEIEPGYALPMAEDTGNTVNHRQWELRLRVVVRSPLPCAQGNLQLRQNGNGLGLRSWSSRSPGTRSWWEVWDYPGKTVEIGATATCEAGRAAGLRGTATASTVIPRRVCSARALRVLSVDGKAERNGKPLRVGQEVLGVIHVLRGRVVVGVPECNGYHAILQHGRTTVGGYDPNGRGEPFRGRSVVLARADEHAGGYAPPEFLAFVYPEGDRCAECPLSLPASFAARSDATRLAVRVYAASVVVGRFGGRYVRVRAGEQLFVTCATPETCRLGRPALYQPREPFLLTPPRRRPFARVIEGVRRPVIELLAPQHGFADVLELRGHGKVELLAVTWWRSVRTPAGHPVDLGKGSYVPARNIVSLEKGLAVWRRTGTAWRRAYTRRYAELANFGIARGDVTSDGIDDVLVTHSQGSGACGVRAVLAVVNGVVREIFRRSWCETGIAALTGDLVVHTPYGPCPVQPGAAHCYAGVQHERLHWDGGRFRRAAVWLTCVAPDLDPRPGLSQEVMEGPVARPLHAVC
jgi:hypothetical protein